MVCIIKVKVTSLLNKAYGKVLIHIHVEIYKQTKSTHTHKGRINFDITPFWLVANT